MSTTRWGESRVEERFRDFVSPGVGVIGVSVAAFVVAIASLFVTVVAAVIAVVVIGAAAGVATGDTSVARTVGELVWVGIAFAYLTWLPIVGGIVWYFDLPLGVGVPDVRGVAWSVGAFVLVTGLSVGTSVLFSEAGVTGVTGGATGSPGLTVAVGLVVAFVVGAVVEELLFRGTIQGLLRDQFSATAAIVGANVLFVPIHFLNNLGQPPVVMAVNLTVILILGLVVGSIYERYHNIVLPAAVHAAYNAVVIAAAFLLL